MIGAVRNWALLLVLLPAVFGLPSASAQPESLEEQLRQVLEVRANAVSEGDEPAFMNTVEPGEGEFRSGQLAWFRQMVRLPIEDYELTLALEEFGEFTRDRDREQFGDTAVVIAVEERYRIAGFDEASDLNDLVYTFAQRDGRWVIVSDVALDDLGIFTDRQLWDFGEVEWVNSEQVLVVFHPGSRGSGEQILQRAASAVGGVGRVWRQPWSQKVVLYLPASTEELEGLLAVTFDVTNFVAFAAASLDLREGFRLVGSRVIVNPSNFLRRSAAIRTVILIHELVHVSTRSASGPFVPNWVEEGLATFAESDPPRSLGAISREVQVAAGDRLPEDLRFTSGSGEEIRNAYAESRSAITFMAERFGVEEMNQFYVVLGAVRLEPGTARYHIDRALRETLGIGFEEFQAAWVEAVS